MDGLSRDFAMTSKPSCKPNLLFICTDQQRWDTLRACGAGYHLQAPNLNRLAGESFVFRNAYCAQPVCTPARGTIFCGLWPHTHGSDTLNVPLSPEIATIAELVSDEYRTAYYGKWHLGDEIFVQHGFDEWKGIMDRYSQYYSNPECRHERSSYHHFLVRNGYAPDSHDRFGGHIFSRAFTAALAEPFTKAAFIGNEAAEFVSRQSLEQPFLLVVSFFEPHPPTFGPFNHLYDPSSLPFPDTFHCPPGDDIQAKARQRFLEFSTSGYYNFPLTTDWDWQRVWANYHGLVTLVDRALGRIFQALDESDLRDNTIVVFTSDHGEMLGSHHLMKKGLFYEEAVRVPWVIRVPWLTREQRLIDGRISHIDLLPTLLDLMDEELPDHLQGCSRADVLRGTGSLSNNDIVIEWNELEGPRHEGRALITAEGWKLCLLCEDQSMLFDLRSDPGERRNLFHDRAHLSRIREMAMRLRDWQKRTNDSLPLPSV